MTAFIVLISLCVISMLYFIFYAVYHCKNKKLISIPIDIGFAVAWGYCLLNLLINNS